MSGALYLDRHGEPPACPFCRSSHPCDCAHSLLAEGKGVTDALLVEQIRTARKAAMCGELNCVREDCAGIVYESTLCENGHRQSDGSSVHGDTWLGVPVRQVDERTSRVSWDLTTEQVKHLVEFHRRHGRNERGL